VLGVLHPGRRRRPHGHLRGRPNEARLFKYGSGTGSNFSAIRGRQEKLSGGGTSSGLMSFLEVFDRAAGAPRAAAPPAAPPRWSASTSTTRRSRTSSTGRSVKRRRRAPSSPPATTPTSTARPTAPSAARTPTTRCASRTTSCAPSRPTATGRPASAPPARSATPQGARPVEEDQRGRVVVCRSRRAVRHHHQRLAHVPEHGPHQREQPVLRVHVPRRLGV
jgi:hypothetical protein